MGVGKAGGEYALSLGSISFHVYIVKCKHLKTLKVL